MRNKRVGMGVGRWVEEALRHLPAAGLEVTAKHVLAQMCKEFWGFGPRGRVDLVVAGDLLVYASSLEGALVMEDLAADPRGQEAVLYMTGLFRRRYGPALRDMCRSFLGADLVGILGDVDFGAGVNVGVAVLSRRLRENVRPLPAGLARAWEGLLHRAGLAVEATGRAEDLLFARGRAVAPGGAGGGGELLPARGRAGGAGCHRPALREELRAAAEREAGLPGRASFLAVEDGLFVGGVLTGRPC